MKNLTKQQLITILEHIEDIASRKSDPYEEDDMRIMQIQSISAQALERKEIIPEAWPISWIIEGK